MIPHHLMHQLPHPSLAGFIKSVWVGMPGDKASPASREHILPSGDMHLVFRLRGPEIRIFDDQHPADGLGLGHAVVGGARASFYAKEVAGTSETVGVQLMPGAALALLGLPANELAGQHTRLEDLWGNSARWMQEQLAEAATPAQKMQGLQGILRARLKSTSPSVASPAMVWAAAQLKAGATVRQTVAQSGYSHRQFIQLFSHHVGLAPKQYSRVQRFQRALGLLHHGVAARPVSLADVAQDAGYSDQPHFNREFRECSGFTPEQYRQAPVLSPNHVPLLATGPSILFKT